MANHTPRTFSVNAKPAAQSAVAAPTVPALQVRTANGDPKFYDFESSSPIVGQRWDSWVAAREALHASELFKQERKLREELLTECKTDLQQSQSPVLVSTRAAFPTLTFVVSLRFGKLAFAMVEPEAKKAGKAKIIT